MTHGLPAQPAQQIIELHEPVSATAHYAYANHYGPKQSHLVNYCAI
jgi:hypothetical protein